MRSQFSRHILASLLQTKNTFAELPSFAVAKWIRLVVLWRLEVVCELQVNAQVSLSASG